MSERTIKGTNSLVLVVSCLFLALALAAGEFWEEKPYQEWSQAEVQTIITRSPWGQEVKAGGPGPGFDWGGLSRPEGEGARPMGTVATGPAGEPPLPQAGSRGDDATEGGRSSRPGSSTFYVLWSSAMTVRRALLRNQLLHQMITADQAGEMLEQPVSGYTLTIIGQDLSAFGQVSEEELKAHSTLDARKQKQKVHPLEVQIARIGPQEQINSVTFIFPRTLASGESLIVPKEKKVEFTCEIKPANIKIKAAFDPRRMKLGEEIDL